MADLTMNELLLALRQEILPAEAQVPLADHTTFHIGGPAGIFCTPKTVVELTRILELCRQHQARVYLLGKGSNTLFSDAGYNGVVVCFHGMRSRMAMEKQADGGVLLSVSAGEMLMGLCAAARDSALTGLEFACGIPGTVGGAVYMNAGAYGGEMKDVVRQVTFLDEDLCLRTLPAEELELGYRTSIFEKRNWCIVEATVLLRPGNKDEIAARMQELLCRRREKQPLEFPSAGSTFKRPQGAFAGKLIEDCGLRGFTVGGAQISEKHCGFVINRGGATCADVVALTDRVREIVRKKTGYVLEREIRVVE